MLKKLALCSLFIGSSLFASNGEEKSNYVCQAAVHAMNKFEEIYIPSDKDSCHTDKDCSFFSRASWQRAEGVNKTALAGRAMMLKDSNYKALAHQADYHCSHIHPMVIFQMPTGAECVENKCVPKY